MLAPGRKGGMVTRLFAAGLLGCVASAAEAAVHVEGQVQAGGGTVAGSTVSLWAATANAPARLAQATTGADGSFVVSVDQTPDGASLYLVAAGGTPAVSKQGGANPAIALMTVLGSNPPAKVTINEMTTVASVWTHAQFIDGTAIEGYALGLRIAAGNVPNFVDLSTGGYGDMIQDGLNSTQTPTMANFATLSSVLAGCAIRVKPDACSSLFAAATGRDGKAPTDTLTAAISIAHNMGYKPERVFALLDAFYPVPQGKHLRPTPFMPYLSFAPGCVGVAAQVLRWRQRGRRQNHVRQRGQRLERRQFPRRVAGARRFMGRQFVEVRAGRKARFHR